MNEFLNKYEWYRNWHEKPEHVFTHWFVFVLFSIFTLTNLYSEINNNSNLLALALESESKVELDTKVNGPKPTFSYRERAIGSDAVVSGKVAQSEAKYVTNEYGDKIIVTRATVNVNKKIKGVMESSLDVEMMGGTVNGITMGASHSAEPLNEGEEAILFLKSNSNGKWSVTFGDEGVVRMNNKKTTDGLNTSIDQISKEIGVIR